MSHPHAAFPRRGVHPTALRPRPLLVEECLSGPEFSIFAAIVDDPTSSSPRPATTSGRWTTTSGRTPAAWGPSPAADLIDGRPVRPDRTRNHPPTVNGLRSRPSAVPRIPLLRLMLTADGPKVIEYNCRFGDPECQAVMPLVGVTSRHSASQVRAASSKPDLLTFDDGWSVCVILASAGYPESSRSGDPSDGLDPARDHPGLSCRHPAHPRMAPGKPTAAGCWRSSRRAATHAKKPPRHTPPPTSSNSTARQRRRDIGILHFD
jgi:phosphoribosylamine---glycine ligase